MKSFSSSAGRVASEERFDSIRRGHSFKKLGKAPAYYHVVAFSVKVNLLLLLILSRRVALQDMIIENVTHAVMNGIKLDDVKSA